ncbi:AMP-binding protein [Kineosporia succinea]|uniref:Acyl-coenzyme A synthetase/AMP-(Fatty) acid ligase/thioesterase domain-containing protein n=1 Tax=Kineosporia succinea TaxID=84632 RepID=A0ABT9P5A7_9ACTN|nr:AMP-binding protein [Kineosporia succinea]MDP9827876.1 acyl-coenzyme A synthetase/AMP-(fatty) acid ligase/thioesterase domain-containing protein [Kineosporia succinea]
MNPRYEQTQRPVDPLGYPDIDGGAIARLHRVVTAQPDAVAVRDDSTSVTYREFALHTAAVRREVVDAEGTSPARGVRETTPAPPERAVALLYSHDVSAVSALWGVIASGRPVLVLDPRTPVARLRSFVERVDVKVCVTDQANAQTAAELVDDVIVSSPDGTSTATDADLAELWSQAPEPTTTAVYAFTSGSTGRPKVVVHDHRMLVREAWAIAMATDTYGADDVVAHSLPMAFYAGLMAACAGPLIGATTAMYDIRARGLAELPAWIERNGATILQVSPAILRNLTGSSPDPQRLRTIRSVTFAGEATYGPDLEAARALFPETCVFRNKYGSSETGYCTEYRVDPTHPPVDGVLPSGAPMPDVRLGLVNDDGSPVSGTGTVTLTGPHFALRYLGDPAATDKAFSGTGIDRTYRSNDVGTIDEHGVLRLLGRRDHSVKIRGYLVEPGEVDAALSSLDDLRESITVGAERGNGATGKRLVSYIVSSSDRPSATVVRQHLATLLPSWMVPETVVFLEALPRTDRGKLDRAALPEPPVVKAGQGSENLSEWEEVVRALWCSVLALPEIGLDDDFFELGGDSLAAESLMTRMAAELGVPSNEAQTTVLVQAPTLKEFAERVTRKIDAAGQTLIPLRAGGSRPPLFIFTGGGGLGVTMVPLTRHLPSDQPVFALQAHGLEARGVPDWSVEASARRHIRTLRSIQPAGPYFIAGHSFGGVLSLEVAHQLREAGQEVALLIVLDSFPPDGKSHVPLEGSTVQKFRAVLGVATTGLRGTPGDDQYWRFWRQSNFLHMRYRAKAYDGETLVIVAADSDEKAVRRSWAPYLTGTWRLTHVPGDHMSILRDPYAVRTSAVIREQLESAQRKTRGAPARAREHTRRPRLLRTGKAWPDQY